MKHLRLAFLAAAFAACSPAYPSIGDTLDRIRVEPGQTLTVDVRFCFDGPHTSDDAFTVSADFDVEVDGARTVIEGAAYVGDDDEAIDVIERTEVEPDAFAETWLDLDGTGPWSRGSGQRCGEWQTLVVTTDAESDAAWIEVSAFMSFENVDEDISDDQFAIEWGEPAITP